MGIRDKLRKQRERVSDRLDKIGLHGENEQRLLTSPLSPSLFEINRMTSGPVDLLGAWAHDERTKDDGDLRQDEEEEEDPVVATPTPPQEQVDEEAARKARRRSKARQRSGRSSTILTGGLGGGDDTLGV